MRKFNLLFWLLATVVVVFSACSSDEDDPKYSESKIRIFVPEGGYLINKGKTVVIDPHVETIPGDRFTWEVNDQVVSDKLVLNYEQTEVGSYNAKLTIVNNKELYRKTGEVSFLIVNPNQISIPEPAGGYKIITGEKINIDPGLPLKADDQVRWEWNGELLSTEHVVEVWSDEAGTFELKLTITNPVELTVKSGTITITVVYDNINYVRLNLKDFDLSNGLITYGGKYWSGTYTPNTNITSGIFHLSHTAKTWEEGLTTWSGFTVSNATDTSEKGNYLESQFISIAGAGVKDNYNPYVTNRADQPIPYLVSYTQPDFTEEEKEELTDKKFSETEFFSWIKIGDDENTYTPVGAYFSNSAYTYYCIAKGNNFSNKFKQGDYLYLRVYGVDAENGITGNVSVTLADCTAENEADWIIHNTWEWTDLAGLGEVKYLFFLLESTDVGDHGVNTPLYFCMDQLTVEKTNSMEEE